MITINPENPSSDDSVVFTFVYPENMCSTTSKTVEGNHFHYKQSWADGPCISTIIPMEVSWGVGRLQAGDYQVTLTDKWSGTETQGFVVSEGELPFPAPPIPALGYAGAILLAITLAWIANKTLKRMPRRTA